MGLNNNGPGRPLARWAVGFLGRAVGRGLLMTLINEIVFYPKKKDFLYDNSFPKNYNVVVVVVVVGFFFFFFFMVSTFSHDWLYKKIRGQKKLSFDFTYLIWC